MNNMIAYIAYEAELITTSEVEINDEVIGITKGKKMKTTEIPV